MLQDQFYWTLSSLYSLGDNDNDVDDCITATTTNTIAVSLLIIIIIKYIIKCNFFYSQTTTQIFI